MRLGELLGQELGTYRYSGAAVSDWERGKSKIHADDRRLLLSLIKVLYKFGGLRALDEANTFLESGNYRGLNPHEAKMVFPETSSGIPSQESVSPAQKTERTQGIMGMAGKTFLKTLPEFQDILMMAKEGPSPYWPRVLAALLRRVSDRWSLSVSSLIWAGVWLMTWWLIAPSLRWPFVDRDSARLAIGMYVIGTLIIPLLIGLLVDTKNNDYWKQQESVSSVLLRLYTYQGAGIGFNLGYFFIFPLVLLRYYLSLESSISLELIAVTSGLILGNMSARVVPHNLWLAYGRLHLSDGAMFFVVALLGPMWGLFFLEFYSVLLTPLLGSVVILLALIMAVSIARRQSRKRIDEVRTS
ncbi:MAG TPA: hypothetical protein VJ821_00520 [Anaerolineales bacterium]|nr:hypothetical protein [Anaerolineales bacterium]